MLWSSCLNSIDLMDHTKSIQLFEKAQLSIPGGVNSPVRAFKGVGGYPVFIHSAIGAYLFDVDGNRYIDYINSWGPMILGHSFPPVVRAIQEQALHSSSFGAPTELELQMAELIVKMVPNIELVRMVNSGTEACMSAIRLARGYTGKNLILKFEGNYHGHADSFLIGAGSGVATLGIQAVPGITKGTSQDTLMVSYNDLMAVEKIVKKHPGQIACIIVEPVAGNMGCIPPSPGFLKGLREISQSAGILLILDEVMTGFRLAQGGAQELFNISGDLITFGKIIGGGLPVGAFAGKREIMDWIAPVGKVYQAGTLSGNPIAMSAGLALLETLHKNNDLYNSLNRKTEYLVNGLNQIFGEAGIMHQINSVGSMLSLHFSDKPITDFNSASASDNLLFAKFFHSMLEKGIYLPPSGFESWFISEALSEEDIDTTLEAARQSIEEM